MAELIQILTTVEREEEAEGIASELVERRLAACVQIVALSRAPTAGTTRCKLRKSGSAGSRRGRDLYDDVESAIRQLHAYEVPEIIAMPIIDGSKDYLEWVAENAGPGVTWAIGGQCTELGLPRPAGRRRSDRAHFLTVVGRGP